MDDDGGLMFWQQQGHQQEQFEIAEMLRTIFEYVDGDLIWKVKKGRARVGDKVNGLSLNGYKRVGIDGKVYLVHRIIYAMFNNDFPERIDHIDNNRSNNRIDNLRPSTARENGWNALISTSNKSGVKGVSWHKKSSKWQAHLRTMLGNEYVGLFTSLDDAKTALAELRNKRHGSFANNG